MSASGVTKVDLVVPPDMDGLRADRIVAGLLDISRSAARSAVDDGRVRGADGVVRPADKLAAGDAITVSRDEPAAGLVPLDAPLTVRYESSAVMVVDKPAGIVVHPGAGHRDDTLASVLIHHRPELAELGEETRWGLVHRLDRDTSGLLLVAKTAEAHAELQGQLKARSVRRTYLALVVGVVEPATGTIEAPIGRDREHPTRMALRQDGRYARTHFRRLAAWQDLALLSVQLDTGRTHQIRVHLSSIGAPIAGDKTYGGRRAATGDPGRVWLHAHRLAFVDPAKSGEHVTVVSPLPDDLMTGLNTLGEPTTGAISFDGSTGELSI